MIDLHIIAWHSTVHQHLPTRRVSAHAVLDLPYELSRLNESDPRFRSVLVLIEAPPSPSHISCHPEIPIRRLPLSSRSRLSGAAGSFVRAHPVLELWSLRSQRPFLIPLLPFSFFRERSHPFLVVSPRDAMPCHSTWARVFRGCNGSPLGHAPQPQVHAAARRCTRRRGTGSAQGPNNGGCRPSGRHPAGRT